MQVLMWQSPLTRLVDRMALPSHPNECCYLLIEEEEEVCQQGTPGGNSRKCAGIYAFQAQCCQTLKMSINDTKFGYNMVIQNWRGKQYLIVKKLMLPKENYRFKVFLHVCVQSDLYKYFTTVHMFVLNNITNWFLNTLNGFMDS